MAKRSFLQEFKEFALRGSVLDLAVGVIVGAAFGKIVDSLVKDIIMPPIGLLAGRVDFANRFLVLTGGSFETLAEAQKAGAVTMNYGNFLNVAINFLLVAFAVFLMVRQVNRFRRTDVPPTPTEKPCFACCKSIAIAATRCPYCTSELPSAVPAKTSSRRSR